MSYDDLVIILSGQKNCSSVFDGIQMYAAVSKNRDGFEAFNNAITHTWDNTIGGTPLALVGQEWFDKMGWLQDFLGSAQMHALPVYLVFRGQKKALENLRTWLQTEAMINPFPVYHFGEFADKSTALVLAGLDKARRF